MERMEKQTAVEWLANEIIELEEKLRQELININHFMDSKDKLVNKALEMEKEQIIEAHKQASMEAGFEDSAEDWANEYWERNYKV